MYCILKHKLFVIILCMLFLFTGCAEDAPPEQMQTPLPVEDSVIERPDYSEEEKKTIFYKNIGRFDSLVKMMEESQYEYLSASFYDPEQIQWNIQWKIKNDCQDEMDLREIVSTNEDDIDEHIRRRIISFSEKVPCSNVVWDIREDVPHASRCTIFIWGGSNNGISYGTVSEDPGMDEFQEQLSPNWYYWWYPAI